MQMFNNAKFYSMQTPGFKLKMDQVEPKILPKPKVMLYYPRNRADLPSRSFSIKPQKGKDLGPGQYHAD